MKGGLKHNTMKNDTNLYLIGIIALIVGALLTYGLFPRTEFVDKTVIKEVEGPIKYVNQTTINEVIIEDASFLLTNAIKDAWDRELSDNEKFLTCGTTEYDEDEVVLSKVKTWGYHWIDDDEYNVGYQARFKYDSSNDDDRCTKTWNVLVHYEDGEKPKVSFS